MEWKKIDGYESYSVSKDGEVRNNKTGRILKKCKDKTGYECVNLYKNGKRKLFRIHRLVAITFIPNPENKQCVDHINCIRDDNRVENLRWCTHKENNNNALTLENYSKANKGENNYWYGKQHSEKTKKRMIENHADFSGKNNPCCRKIICITTGEVFDYIKQASEKYCVSRPNISGCCRHKTKSAGKDKDGNKLVWMYYEDYVKEISENEIIR